MNATKQIDDTRLLANITRAISQRAHTTPHYEAAEQRFGAINGWHVCGQFAIERLGRSYRVDHSGKLRASWLDHPIYYKQRTGYRYFECVAIVGQPYGNSEFDQLAAMVASGEYKIHTPPDVAAAIHYPGAAMFIVLTRPGVRVRWLPEQQDFSRERVLRLDSVLRYVVDSEKIKAGIWP
jgi:hypothetical protein